MLFVAIGLILIGTAVEAADVATTVKTHARLNGVNPSFALAIAKQESGLRCHVVSGGAYGVMQIKPRTARGVGYKGTPKGLLDCTTNIKYGMIYLKQAIVRARGNLCVAAGLYNRGLYSKPRSSSSYCSSVKKKM